jgi:hypothetical protein
VPKECNMRSHYETLYKDKFGVLEGKLREDTLKNLKCDLQRLQNIYLLLLLNQIKQQFMQVLLFHK